MALRLRALNHYISNLLQLRSTWPRYDFNGRLGWEIITDSIIWNWFSMSAVRQSAETPQRRQQLLEKLTYIRGLQTFWHRAPKKLDTVSSKPSIWVFFHVQYIFQTILKFFVKLTKALLIWC